MSFLTPLFLLGLIAAAIPLAIHLIRRNRPRQVRFSSLRFLRHTRRTPLWLQRMQQWLLLLLRTLALALLVVAFARPFFNQSLSGWADLAPQSVVLLLDHSMSMKYGDQMERARAAARKILGDLNPGDEATLVLFTDTARAVHGPTSDLSRLRGAIAQLDDPGFEPTRYFPALRMADEMLAASRFEERTIYLISDFQQSGMEQFQQDWTLGPGVNLMVKNVGREKRANLAVTAVRTPSNLRGEGEKELAVQVRSLGRLRREKAEIALVVDQEERWRRTVELTEDRETIVKVPFHFTDTGAHSGKVTVTDTDFEADNDFYFTLDVPPRLPVLVLNGESSKNWFEDEAHWFTLAAGGNDQSPFALRVIEADRFQSGDLRGQKVAVLLNVGELDNEQTQALVSFVGNGGSVLLAPGDKVDAADFNQRLARISPATLVGRTDHKSGEYLLVAEVDNRHPILRSLDTHWTARFHQSWLLEPAESAQVLMTYDNGAPALVEGSVGKGRALMFATALDLEWSNLPLQTLYLPLIHEALKHLAARPENQPGYVVGDSVAAPEAPDDVVDPQGHTATLEKVADRFTFQEPGIYRREDEGGARYYAVNRPVGESDFAAVSPTAIIDRVMNPDTEVRQSAAVRTRLLEAELEKPQRVWWWILLAVGALLVAESFIANRTYR